MGFSILKKRIDGGVERVVVATGIASVAVQLVFVREYLAQFEGNEIVIALIFFCWLVLGGIGTAAAKSLGARMVPPSAAVLGRLSCLLAIFSVLQIVAVRWLRDLVFIHGASVGFSATLGYVAATIAPYALLVGFVLPYSMMVARLRTPDYPGNRIYLADNAGDVAGAALFSFALVYWLTPFQALFAVHLPLLASLVTLPSERPYRTLATGILAFVVLAAGAVREDRLLPPREGRRIAYAESRYGRLEVVESDGQISFFSDGAPVLTSHDPALAEECVHFPLSQIDHPKRVLLVSMVGGMLAEVAKYHPDRVDYVELDPLAAWMQRRFGLLPAMDGLTVIAKDGRAHLIETSLRYDAILINLPEPETYQTNRFFTAEFFELAKNRLAPGGVFCFAIEGVENYISSTRQQKLSSLANTAGACFAHVTLLPGQRLFFLCRDRPIRTDIPLLLETKGIDTRHIRRYFSGDLTDPRIRQVNAAVNPGIPQNRDLSPRLMRLAFLGWFQRYGESPLWFALLLAAAALFYAWRLSRPQWVLLTTGCIGIGAEMLAIFAFQALYGYIYLRIGALVTVFLAGMFPGAWTGGRLAAKRRRALVAGDLMLGALLLLFFLLMQRQSLGSAAWVLYLFGLAVSFFCGFQFPLALALSGDDTAAASRSFSADLVGAAMGVLVVSLALIPFLGILRTSLCLAAMKFVSAMVAGTIHENN
jgi:spermidine synthase